jgi:hypothetical protein
MKIALPKVHSLSRMSIRLCEYVNRAMAALPTMQERTVRVMHAPR